MCAEVEVRPPSVPEVAHSGGAMLWSNELRHSLFRPTCTGPAPQGVSIA